MSMRHVVIYGMPGSTIFFHNIAQTVGFLLKKSHWTYNVLWCSVQTLSEKFLILRRSERDLIISEHGSACKVLDILLGFSWKLNFVDTFLKMRQWDPRCCMQTDAQTDRYAEANSPFSQFCEKKSLKMVALYRGLTVFGETTIPCLNVSTRKWPFSCQFQASTSHLSQLKLCYDTVQSGKAVWTTTPFKA